MFKFIKDMFHKHSWYLVTREKGRATMYSMFKDYGKQRVFLEIHKCDKCGQERAVIRSVYGSEEIDLCYAKSLLDG